MTTTTNTTPTQHNCADCNALVSEGQARVSRRACRAVYCWRCRRRRWPAFDQADEIPGGCALQTGATGYGQFTATLTTPDGREWFGGGRTLQTAYSNARIKARSAGALA